ncbi:MAG: hypothetical protein M1308_11805 [Actinobacteria bacterium]|nr:hypothetical protein [Actinomycetota bacterium]
MSKDTKKQSEENPFGGDFKESQAGAFIKWEKVGQTFKGIYKDSYELENSLTGSMQKIYVFQGEDGSDYRIGSRGLAFDNQLKGAVYGQHVAFLFADEIESKKKGNNAFKLIKVYLGPLEKDWITYEPVGEINAEDILK